MDFKKLKEFISIAKEAGATELEFEDGDRKFSVSFQASGAVVMPASQPVMQQAPAAVQASAPAAKDDGLLEITSPFVGTFYRAASPESEPYAKAGQKISKGQVLCIVEAMKIMNEIESDFTGEIVEICVENETYVEFGQVLFKVRP